MGQGLEKFCLERGIQRAGEAPCQVEGGGETLYFGIVRTVAHDEARMREGNHPVRLRRTREDVEASGRIVGSARRAPPVADGLPAMQSA